MINEVLTPKSDAFFEWGYDAQECIEQLALLNSCSATALPSVSEWVALALETASVKYYKNDFESVTSLVVAISSAILSLESSHLKSFPILLHNGLRAVLSSPHQYIDDSRLLEMYRLLPKTPCAKTLDIYIMFQCYFGFSNQLSGWRNKFDYHEIENGWLENNMLQLDVGIALVKGVTGIEASLIEKLNAQFPKFVLAIEDEPLAAEWFPWLSWFIVGREYN